MHTPDRQAMASGDCHTYETLTPGAHHGPTVSVRRRGDGVLVRLEQGEDRLEAFLELGQCEALADVLLDEVFTAQHQQRAAQRLAGG